MLNPSYHVFLGPQFWLSSLFYLEFHWSSQFHLLSFYFSSLIFLDLFLVHPQIFIPHQFFSFIPSLLGPSNFSFLLNFFFFFVFCVFSLVSSLTLISLLIHSFFKSFNYYYYYRFGFHGSLSLVKTLLFPPIFTPHFSFPNVILVVSPRFCHVISSSPLFILCNVGFHSCLVLFFSSCDVLLNLCCNQSFNYFQEFDYDISLM